MRLIKNATRNHRASSEAYGAASTAEAVEPSGLVVEQKKRRTTFDEEDDEYIEEEEERPRGSQKNRGAAPRKPGRKEKTSSLEKTPAGGSVKEKVSSTFAANNSINVAQEPSIVVAAPAARTTKGSVSMTTNSPSIGQATATPTPAVKKTVEFVKRASSSGSGFKSGPVAGPTKLVDSGLPKGNTVTSNANSGSLVGLASQPFISESQLAQPIQLSAESASLPFPGVSGHSALGEPNRSFGNASRETDQMISSEIVAIMPEMAPEAQQAVDATSITVRTGALSKIGPEMTTKSGEEPLPEPPGALEVPVKKSRGRPGKQVAESVNTLGAVPSELPSGSSLQSHETSETPESNKFRSEPMTEPLPTSDPVNTPPQSATSRSKTPEENLDPPMPAPIFVEHSSHTTEKEKPLAFPNTIQSRH
ncbi:hypothetical protein B0T22DRAFT_125250 [Podospora appendiculata]|uniref:Uncharacterized protein n=1 Tax=Podospora appendiculata TaxID=314037 RepID=A0AAE0X791_9PEZI|nr:hypothetical protein B0T22DRAFT_125250 [Podospora appendiculata]